MIKSFRHKGLKRLYEDGETFKVMQSHVPRLRRILAALEQAREIKDMNLPGFRLHPLTGKRKGEWAVTVSGNWRVIFNFEDGNAYNVDYGDYH